MPGPVGPQNVAVVLWGFSSRCGGGLRPRRAPTTSGARSGSGGGRAIPSPQSRGRRCPRRAPSLRGRLSLHGTRILRGSPMPCRARSRNCLARLGAQPASLPACFPSASASPSSACACRAFPCPFLLLHIPTRDACEQLSNTILLKYMCVCVYRYENITYDSRADDMSSPV